MKRLQEANIAAKKAETQISDKTLLSYTQIQIFALNGNGQQLLDHLEEILERKDIGIHDFYNIACATAIASEIMMPSDAIIQLKLRIMAVTFFSSAIDMGYSNVLWMREDPDLKSLYGDSGFQRIVSFLEKSDENNVPDLGYWIKDREVSQSQFELFLNDMSYLASGKPLDWRGFYVVSFRNPADNISWVDAVLFCNWLSLRERRTVSYRPAETHEFWELVPGADGYRLPSETEWVFACTAGSQT